jgi:hypothetical protein
LLQLPAAQAAVQHRVFRWLTTHIWLQLAALITGLPAVVPDKIRRKGNRRLNLSLQTCDSIRLQHTFRYGDDILIKQKNTLRVAFQNIGGFPSNKKDLKEDYIRIGLSLDWRLIPEEDKLWGRTREWWEH